MRLQTTKHQYPESLFYNGLVNNHPLKHLVLIEALFDNWNDFTHSISQNKRWQMTTEEPMEKKETLLTTDMAKRLKAGESMRSVSSDLGLSVSTLRIHAQKAGIEVNTRPSKIFKSDERFIWRKLLVGEKTQAIAEELELSMGAVEKVLTKYSELKQLRKRIWYLTIFKFHKNKITTYLQRHGNAKRNQIKQDVSASYMWLYKHEKQWLYQHLPPEIPREVRNKKIKNCHT